MPRMGENNHKKWIAILFCVMTVGVMVAIFWFSSQAGNDSNRLSTKVEDKIAGTVLEKVTPSVLSNLSITIRKWGHIYIYALLGFVAGLCSCLLRFRRKWVTVTLPAAVCLLYSCTDELHQLFVPGRTSRVTDLGFDAAGWAPGLLGALALCAICRKIAASRNWIRNPRTK